MSPPVYVVDTNVVVAGLLAASPSSPVALILDAMLAGTLVYLLSPPLLAEYRSVLLRPKPTRRHGLTESEVDAVLAELAANAMWREPGGGPSAPDPGDDHLWALLHAHAGSTLITGDRALLEAPIATGSVIGPGAWADTCTRPH